MNKPTHDELVQAEGTSMADIVALDLDILFCGINPGLYSAASGHHFGRPGNKFWKALYLGGLTPRLLDPSEDQLLPTFGLGITSFVNRATAAADQLNPAEFVVGVDRLKGLVKKYHPKCIAFLGVGAYRLAFGQPKASIGLQSGLIGQARVWVLPNPSGLNAHFQAADLGRMFAGLKMC